MNQEADSKGRNIFIVEVVCATVIGNLVGGVFLSGYLAHIGLSPKLNGIISAIPVIATVFQPFGAAVGSVGRRCKRFVVTFALVQRLLFSLFYCLPLLMRVDIRACAAVLIFGCANAFAAFMTPSATNWLMELTPSSVRQEYFSRREIALVTVGAVLSLVMGFTIQYFMDLGSPEAGYHILAAVIFLFAAINIGCLLSIPAAPEASGIRKASPRVSQTLKEPLRSLRFRRVILTICLYEFAVQCAVPFWNIHALENLKRSVAYMTALGVAVSLCKVVFLRQWRRVRSHRTWSRLCVFSFCCLAAGHLLNALAWDKIAAWYLPLPSLFGALGWALVGMGTLNFEYDNADGSDKAVFVGMAAVAAGISGFLGTLLGGMLMDAADRLRLTAAGRPVAGQQLQMILSCVLLLCAAGYLRASVQKGAVR